VAVADTTTLAPTATPETESTVPSDGAGDRGRLEISPRALERIAEITAREVQGVIRREATLGRGLPKAKALLAGQRVRLDVVLAVVWGYALAELAAEVRGRVTRAITDLTGLGVDAVSIDISAVELARPDNHANPRRVG
jgi:uncharacterized alkaline shock family protein YloU